MNRALLVFAWGWAALVALLNLVGIAGMFLGAPDAGAAFDRLREVYSPFNLWTHGLNVALLLPAFGAWKWRERRMRNA